MMLIFNAMTRKCIVALDNEYESTVICETCSPSKHERWWKINNKEVMA